MMMMFFLYLFRVRALTANLPTGLQNLEEPTVDVVVAVADAATAEDNPLPSTSAAAAAETESAPPPPPSTPSPPPPPPPQQQPTPTNADEAAVVETTALINENYDAEGAAARRPIASTHRILVPLSHNEWVLFLTCLLSFFS